MKEKKINYGLIIFIGVLVILFIPIIVDYVKKQNIDEISVNVLKEKIESDESFVLYVGELDKKTKKELRKVRDMTTNDYSYPYSVYAVESSDKLNDLIGKDVKVALLIEGDIQKVYTKYDKKNLQEDTETYLVANITDDNKSYKVAENYSEYKKLVKSNKVIMSIFGRNSCTHCNRYKVVYNAVADKYDLDIYYFDSDNYNSKEYEKIINMDLTVPAKCGQTGEDFPLAQFSGTPLTIFTKKGKVVDCISGYVNRENLIDTLKNVSMISE